MPFYVYCDNKNCRKECEPILDRADNKVYCNLCGQTINCVTEFAKNQMVSLGMVKRESKNQQAFSVTCHRCNKSNPPVLNNDKLFCAACNEHLSKVSAPFALAIKEFLKSQGIRNK